MRWWTVLAGLVVAVQAVEASRILFLSPICSKSHTNFFLGIASALASKGNQITFLSPYKTSKVRNNIQEVLLPDMDITKIMPNLFHGNKISGPLTLFEMAPKVCNDALAKRETQDLLKEKFDVVLLSMFVSDCFLSVIHQLNVPYIYVSPAGLFGPFAHVVGNPTFPSFANNVLFTAKHPYSFLQRMVVALSEVAMNGVFEYYLNPQLEQECRRRGLCPSDMPSFSEMHQNASLVLLNSVKTLERPAIPAMPSVVHVGGIHCHPPQPLPKELEEWVAGAGEAGYIFFSLGSAVTPSSMPEEYRKTLVQVFGSLKQRVLWKWDQDTMEGLPSNVRIGKWLPQQDILGDPRLRLFITHGGLHSTQESIYHGVPVLGMPLFADQHSNLFEVERDGWGTVLLWEDLTPEKMKEKINLVMNNKGMKMEAERRSSVFQDQLLKPGEIAAYWVEYVIRHHGAPHLASPITSMPWYRVYNVDVWAAVTVTVGLLLYALFRLFRALCRWLCCPKPKHKRD